MKYTSVDPFARAGTDEKWRERGRLWPLAVVVLVGGLVAAVVAAWTLPDALDRTDTFFENAVPATAEVLDRNCNGFGRGKKCENVLLFDVNGKPVQVTKKTWARDPGTTVDVLVDPANPNSVEDANVKTGDGTATMVVFVIAAALATVGAAALRGSSYTVSGSTVLIGRSWVQRSVVPFLAASVALLASVAAGAVSWTDRAGAAVTVGSAALVTVGGAVWLFRRPNELLLSRTNIGFVNRDGTVRSVPLTESSSWKPPLAANWHRHTSFKVTAASGDKVSFSTEMWGVSARSTTQIAYRLLARSPVTRTT